MRFVPVRPARLSDVEVLAPLAARWFTTAFSGQVPEQELQPYITASFSAARIAQEMNEPQSCVLVAQAEDGSLVGYAHLLDGPVPIDQSLRGTQIVRLYVETSQIGTGLGAALMRASIAHAHRCQQACIWLRVWERNRRAIGFYIKWGFSRHSLIDFEMLGSIKTDWLMSKRLQRVDASSTG